MALAVEQLLTPSSLAQYFALESASVHRLTAVPLSDLVIDPISDTISLLVVLPGQETPHVPWKLVKLDRATNSSGQIATRLRVDASHGRFEVYSLIVSIASSLVDGSPLDEALNRAMERFQLLTRREEDLAFRELIGLYGEVLTLGSLVPVLGPLGAIDSWIGGDDEEHDFRLESVDLEVKTTVSEGRLHHISSLTQLSPLPDRQLFLASIQVTEGGGSAGDSLSELVDRVAAECEDAAGEFRRKVEARLRNGLVDSRRWTLRSSIEVLSVGAGFPAITPATFAQDKSVTDLLRSLTYVIDVGPLVVAGLSTPIDAWTGAVQGE